MSDAASAASQRKVVVVVKRLLLLVTSRLDLGAAFLRREACAALQDRAL